MKMTFAGFRLVAAGLFSFAVILFACRKEQSGDLNNGTSQQAAAIKVYLTDDQSLVFEKVFIDLQKLEVKIEDNGVDSLGGWMTLAIHPGVYDILQFRNGLDTLFATGTLPANKKLQKVRLTLGNNNSVVKDAQSFPLKVKDKNNEIVINLDETNFEFVGSDQVHFWLDFDAGRSIKQDNSGSGNNHGFELRSHIRAFCKSKSGEIEGRVQPAGAQAIVMAINGTDTATAKPEREGEFKIVGLKAGTYQLLLDATANNYKDSVISNVVVKHDEDTKVGTIVLHQ